MKCCDKTKTTSRQSNYELLRLVCMIMVLNLHSFSGYTHGSGFLQALDFFRQSSSICAVDTFILISGYFGIRWKTKSCFNLLFQVLFYSFAVYGACLAFGILTFDKSVFLHCFKAFYDCWGFITWYIILYFVSPWLNSFADSVSIRKLLSFIIIFFFAEVFIMRSIGPLNFCLIYLIGRSISKIGLSKLSYISQMAGRFYWISTFLIFFFAYSSYLLFHFDASLMGEFPLGFCYASPLVVFQAISLFLFFSNLNITSKFINWCATSCLSIFLIHMHPAIKQIGYLNFTESLYLRPFFEHIGILFILIISIFVCSILIDKLRIYVSDIVYAILNSIALHLSKPVAKMRSPISYYSTKMMGKYNRKSI